MDKKYIILSLAILIGFIMVSLPYLYNDAKANYESDLRLMSIDSDGDHLYDQYEIELGTDPFSEDSDLDLLNDMDEIYLGTSPVEWDTDSDNMADGHELGRSKGSTSPFSKDTDNDGLPDPWEDNDGDEILNREEQLSIHDGIMFFTDMFYEDYDRDIPFSTDPNSADTDRDGWSDGYEIQVNGTHTGPGSISATKDRANSELDIADPNSWAYRFLSNVGGWDPATFNDWKNGLKLAGSYNLIPRQCTKIAWYHFSPWYVYEQGGETGPFNDWLNDTFHGTNEQLYGEMDQGAPYKWNKYDCDPTLNDTDNDRMDDDWDPYPLQINLRNGTFAAVNSVQRVGGPQIQASAPPTDDPWNFFGQDISVLELEKGDLVDINISMGLQQCNPLNASHMNFKNGNFNPMQVVIRFRPIGLGSDGEPHTGDDDIVNFTNVAHLTRTFTNFDDDHVVPGMRERPFTNHLGQSTTITFFYQTFRIRIPSRVPAGHIAITVEAQSENNFHYFPSNPYMVY
jgi:hypothetical protein